MSERVEYSGTATGFKNGEERRQFVELAEEFQDADVEVMNDNEVRLSVMDGWRGGGRTCNEIVENHFGDWIEERPHITIQIKATYVKQAPQEIIYEQTDR